MSAHIVDVWSESANTVSLNPPSWHDFAACKGHLNLFYFAAVGRKADDKNNSAVSAAKQICRDCPVQDECLRFALDNDERYGIWGGLTTRERDRVTGLSITRRRVSLRAAR